MVEQVFEIWISEWASSFANPQKRIFWGYLLAATVIAFIWLRWIRKINPTDSIKLIFSREVWVSESAKADYLVAMINSFLVILISPRLLAKATVAYFVYDAIEIWFGENHYHLIELPQWMIGLSFTLFLFVFDDFARYWVHRWLHTIPILWVFHKIHHSATTLNPFTIFRTHPIESILFSIRSAVVQGLTTAIFFYVFGNQVNLVIVFGASVFTFIFNALGSNLRHSPVSIRYWRSLEHVLMSPAQHHIHHSIAKEHRNKNYGVALSIWDWLFGTLCLTKRNESYTFGLSSRVDKKINSLKTIYIKPFIEVAIIFKKSNFLSKTFKINTINNQR